MIDDVQAVLFDKDGTLIDSDRTWAPAIAQAIEQVSADPATARQLARAIGFDLDSATIQPGADILYCTNAEIVAKAERVVDGEAFVAAVYAASHDTLAKAHHADAVLAALARHGIALALITNDDELVAREQLEALGWTDAFARVYGADSGFGAKPDPGMVIAAVDALGVERSHAIVVGDGDTDLGAARAAGCPSVLVGPNKALVPNADAAIDDLGGLLALLGIT